MKNRLLLPGALALLGFSSASAQTASPVVTWAQSYGVASYDKTGTADSTTSTSGADKPTAIAAMPDGGFVVAGELALPELWQTGNPNGGAGHACAALVRYGADGSILWQQVLRQDNDKSDANAGTTDFRCSHVSQVLADAQGNLFLNMTREDAGIPTGRSAGDFIDHSNTVAKFSADGALVWTFSYDGGASDFTGGGGTVYHQNHHVGGLASISLTADGGVMAAGGEGSDESGFSKPFFIKVNADGSLGFVRAFAPTGQYEGAGAAAQSADGTRYLVAFGSYGAMLTTDLDGNVLAQRSFGDDASSYDVPAQAIANADGTFTVLSIGKINFGAYLFTNNNVIRKLNPDLTSVWETVIPTETPGGSLAATPDGGYVISLNGDGKSLTGGTGDSSKTDALTVRLDANGKLAAAFVVGGPDEDTAPAVAATTDGGYGVAMTSLSYHLDDPLNHSDWWSVKADRQGRVTNFSGVMGNVTANLDVHANTVASTESSHYDAPPGDTGPGGYALNGEPMLVTQDLRAKTGVDQPTSIFQAEPAVGSDHPAFFGGEVALGGGAYYLSFPSGNPFGYYSYLADQNYIYHFDLGYEYLFDANDGKAGMYFYDFKSQGFFYTSPSFPFPYLYDFSLGSTVYYYPDPKNAGRYNTDGVRYFYVFSTGKIISK